MGDVNHRPEMKSSESVWIVKNTFPDVYQPLNDYSGEESLLHTTSILMHEGDYAKAERYFRLGMSLGYLEVANRYATALDTGWIGRVDEELAYAIFKNLAYKRYPIAMYNYGWMILVGHGTKANSRRGHMWIDRAADAGCTVAMTSKGIRLVYESGDNPDFKSAFELFSKAAGAGEETAIYQLGLMYLHGYHVKRNYAKAAEHFQKAIDLGDGCFPEHHLARCYHAGKGVPRDEEKARELVSLAIEHGLSEELVPSWYNTSNLQII